VVNIGSGQIYKDASGNVGIGTASPSVRLNVSGGTRSSIRNDSSGTTVNEYSQSINYAGNGVYYVQDLVYGNGLCSTSASPATNQFYQIGTENSTPTIFITNSSERLRIDSSGGVTIAGLAGSGSRAVNASAAGLLSAASDASLKEEVVGAHIAGLNEILQIHPKMYRWKDDIANRGDEASVELGFIANDVAPIIPSAAPLGNDGLYGFYDRSITAALVKAVQELKTENDSLKSRIEALEAK
jgi:hypothetical protein